MTSKKIYSIRINEKTRNQAAALYQSIDGINLSAGIELALNYTLEQYQQGKIAITKDGIKTI